MKPEPGRLPRIKIEFDSKSNWDFVVCVLLHEVMEFAFCRLEVRYNHTGKINDDTGDHTFMFNHSQFGRACAMAADFLTPVLPLLAKEFHKLQKKKAKKK